MKLINELRQTADGAAALLDWLGDGGVPVEDWQAESRAEVCQHCPLNREPFWWEKHKTAVANYVRKQLEIKGQLGFTVHNEGRLGICRPCGCVLPLKVWVPIRHIRAHTTAETIAQLPETKCWLKDELKAPE